MKKQKEVGRGNALPDKSSNLGSLFTSNSGISKGLKVNLFQSRNNGLYRKNFTQLIPDGESDKEIPANISNERLLDGKLD